MIECRFDPPQISSTTFDLSASGINHSFLNSDTFAIALEKENVILSSPPIVHKIGSNVRGTLSITYKVSDSIEVRIFI